MKANYAVVALVCLVTPLLSAQEKEFTPSGKISGLMFGEYFYNIEQRDESRQDLNGFQFRRIYFTYDYGIAENFATRFRLEADQVANTSNGKIGVFVKDAYLQWKNVLSGSDLFFGISPTPAFDVSEAAWGYRSLEKTIMDLRGTVGSRDIGIDVKGKLMEDGTLRYWVKVGNNSGNAPETDKYKRYYGNIHVKLSSNLQATLYGDFDTRAKRIDAVDGQLKSNNRATVAGFLHFAQQDVFSIGVEAMYQTQQNNFRPIPANVFQSQQIFGVSLFTWYSVSPQVRVVGRYDTFDPNTDLDDDGVSLLILALDYIAAKDVHIIPNIYIQSYQANVSNDVIARLTLGYSY